MTATSFPRWRRAWIRYAITAAFLVVAAGSGLSAVCNDDWAGLLLLPGIGLQLLGAVYSLGMALVSWFRFDYRDAVAEVGVAVLLLLSIPAALMVMDLFMHGGCE
ncbi:hypothetical protein [Scleromatobacter humisilvae]|uniref:Uncharacterized protein n=1 Tax=Scleromatobacter humisilvae TaxID=2897159 RepID=A0A9X1YSR8_9BURK|nr:hypothetical protein [Scleromatobacter humisilvae]MCK9688821.1 hypothetical protein [Scleromatobacter humisilvae]